MTHPSSAPLRLFVEQPPDEPTTLQPPQDANLCRAFAQATGWELRCEKSPVAPGEVWSKAIGVGGVDTERLVLVPAARAETAGEAPPVDLQQVRPLALAVGDLLQEISRLRRAIWEREAELAASVPIAIRSAEEPHLADRLEAVLKGGAEGIGCQAAGLYLLDDSTSELKLRAAFNLPQEKLLGPARPLRGAIADLEALVGHAVVLEDTRLLPHWRCPEDYPSAVCVPVSTPTTPLGTLWLFSESQRDFTPQETNLVEIVAGRIATDLEREMLLAAGAESKQRGKAFDQAARWLADRLPSITPLIDDFDVAGWTDAGDRPSACFHDWNVLPDGRLALAIADTQQSSLAAALDAAALYAAIKAHGTYPHSAAEFLTRLNETLWAASPGDFRAALAYALLDPATGAVDLALAGDAGAIVAAFDDYRLIAPRRPYLGEQAVTQYTANRIVLAPGEALLLASGGVRNASDLAGLRIGEAAIASCLQKQLRNSASGLVARLRRLIDQGNSGPDRSLLVLKRQPARD